jgi:hypothetical protein
LLETNNNVVKIKMYSIKHKPLGHIFHSSIVPLATKIEGCHYTFLREMSRPYSGGIQMVVN